MRDALLRVSTLRDALAFGRPLLAGLLLLGVAGCSVLSGEEAPPPEDASAAAIPAPATDETFPNLGTVPDAAPAVPSAAERQTVIEGLSADRANAQYTDQELTGNAVGASVAPPEPAPPPETISTEPPPAAAPTEPVESAPATPSEAAPASELPAESQAVTEAPAPDPSSAEAPEVISPTAEPASAEPAPEPAAPAAEPLTQASSAMTAPPPAAPAPEAMPAAPPPDPAPAVAPVDPPAPAPAPAATVAAAPAPAPTSTYIRPASPASGLPLPGQPGTVIAPVSTAMPATLPAPYTVPAQPAITSEPIAPPPMPAASTTMPAMPPATTVASVVPDGPFPYQSATSRPASYASGAVTVDMSALDGGGASSSYPAAMSEAYAPLPAAPAAYSSPAYVAAPGAGAPAGMIYFGEGAAGLDASDREVVQGVAAIYRQRGGYIRLLGHASQDGGRAAGFDAQQANLQLSWARANAVARELVRGGVDPGAIETAAVGDSQPLYVESTAAGEAANRRVEIYLVY